jgi:Kef-type K+ transport system membrane component KefB
VQPELLAQASTHDHPANAAIKDEASMHHSAIPTSVVFLMGGGCAVILSYALWRIVRAVVPLGVVQILVAIIIGPAVFGALWPHSWSQVVASSSGAFDAPGWLAVALFTFVAGGQSKLFHERGDLRRTIAIAVSSLVLPFVAGTALGFWFYDSFPILVGSAAHAWTFAFGIGICVATTALPVLALILRDLDLLGTKTGREAIAMAVFSDVVVWIVLGIVVASPQESSAGKSLGAISVTMLLAAVPIVATIIFSRRLAGIKVATDASALTWSFTLIVAAGALAESIGIHFAIGSFFAGLVIPPAIFVRATRVFEPFCLYIALPFFFLSVSAKLSPITELDAFWLCFLTTTAVSILIKFVAAGGSSLLFGADLRESCALGALAQCKGMMEVVGLKILYDANIISAECLAPMLAMAMFTTVCCKPFARLFLRNPASTRMAVSTIPAE